jgi:excisionase family DNA binding protein
MTRALCYSRLKHLPAAVWEQVNGVAWFEHDDGAGGWNTPILLKSFRPLPSSASPKVEASKSAPDYFTSTKAAADYAGITERTIFNWKNRGWLKVEQVGKKIRIAKSELDKCINRQ